jgi:hypothetical protein
MKKLSILLLSIFLTTTIFAKLVELEITSSYKKGNEVIQVIELKINAQLDQEFEVESSNKNPFKLILTASQNPLDKSVSVEGIVSILEKGSLKLIANPKVITNLGKEATLSIKNEKKEIFEIKITPKKIFEQK